MRNALALAGVALVVMASCSRPEPKQPDPGEGYTLQTTGAVIGHDDPQSNEPDSTIGDVATRMASQICEREARCHATTATEERCIRVYSTLTTLAVASWSCSPAAIRARAKECLASLNAEPCELDLTTKPALCPSSDVCPDGNARLLSPGAQVARSLEASAGGSSSSAGGTRGSSSVGGGKRYPAFDRAAADAAVQAVDVTPCREMVGPKGTGHIIVTFAPDGAVLTSTLDRGPDGSAVELEGTPRGQCVVEMYRKARVPLFGGQPRKVGTSVPLD